MPQVDITKLRILQSVMVIAKAITDGEATCSEHEFTEVVMGHSRLNKRVNESDAAAFTRIFTAPENTTLHAAYRVVQQAGHVAALDQVNKGMATLKPTSVEVGSTETNDDSAEAVRLLMEMAEKQGRSFEDVFADPNNKALAGRTYTSAHRPNHSSTSGSELQR